MAAAALLASPAMFAYWRAPVSWTELTRRTVRDTFRDNCPGLAAELAFYFLLALFPMLLVIVSLLSYMNAGPRLGQAVAELEGVLPPEALGLVRRSVEELVGGGYGGLMTAAVAGAIWSSSAAATAIITALNRAYDIVEWRPWWKRRLLAIAMTVALALYIVVAFLLVATGVPWNTAATHCQNGDIRSLSEPPVIRHPAHAYLDFVGTTVAAATHERFHKSEWPMRLNDVIGKAIISADTGEKVGRVDDVLLDGTRRHLVGVLVTDGLLSTQGVLPFEDLQTVGVDAVIVKTVSTMRDASDWVNDGYPAHRSRSVHGKPVVTADGARIGTLHDLVADERTGDIVALEVATGKHGARLTQFALVHAVGSIQLSNDLVVLPQEVAGTRRA
jgi:uncharacterized protein YrrD